MIKLNQLTACCVVSFDTQYSAVTKTQQNLQEIAINQEEKMKKLIAAALTLVPTHRLRVHACGVTVFLDAT